MTAILEGLDSDFRHRFALAVTAIRAELGISVSIVSAYRSRAAQQALWDGYQAKLRNPGDRRYAHFNLAAAPGRSNHERGFAIDIAPNSTSAMRAVFARYGMAFPVSGEPWHVEPLSARGAIMPPLPGIPAPPVPQPLEDDDVFKLVEITTAARDSRKQTATMFLVSGSRLIAVNHPELFALAENPVAIKLGTTASENLLDGFGA